MKHTQHPDRIEQRLRHTLHTVAGTVTESSVAAYPRPGVRRRMPHRRRIAVGVGVLAIPVAFAAAAVVNQGPEYVDTIPSERIVLEGDVDGSRYLLVESDRTNGCGEPVTGVELVEESENLIGSEWNTTGYEYGEPVESSCGNVVDTSRWLAEPAVFGGSGSNVGDSVVWVFTVHPDVTAVRITSGDVREELEVHEVDGAGYALFEIPDGIEEYTSELMIDGEVVPGSRHTQQVQRP